MNIETKDEIVLSVLKKMDQRSIIGQKKVWCNYDGRNCRSKERS